jgi:hypothetical protein
VIGRADIEMVIGHFSTIPPTKDLVSLIFKHPTHLTRLLSSNRFLVEFIDAILHTMFAANATSYATNR